MRPRTYSCRPPNRNIPKRGRQKTKALARRKKLPRAKFEGPEDTEDTATTSTMSRDIDEDVGGSTPDMTRVVENVEPDPSDSETQQSDSRKVAVPSGERVLSVAIPAASAVGVSLSECPLSGCQTRDRRQRRHAMNKDSPSLFSESNADVATLVEALQWLILRTYGETTTMQEVARVVNRSGLVPEGSIIWPTYVNIFREACTILGIDELQELSVPHQFNRRAIILEVYASHTGQLYSGTEGGIS